MRIISTGRSGMNLYHCPSCLIITFHESVFMMISVCLTECLVWLRSSFALHVRDLCLLAGEFRSTGGTLFKILIWIFSSLWCNCVHTLFCSYIIQENFYQYSFFLLYNASSCVTSSVESACALMIISCIFQKSYNWYKIT